MAGPGRTVVMVMLVIDGKPDDAREMVENMLENGAFQDPINDHEDDDYGPLRVRVAKQVTPTDEQHDDGMHGAAECDALEQDAS